MNQPETHGQLARRASRAIGSRWTRAVEVVAGPTSPSDTSCLPCMIDWATRSRATASTTRAARPTRGWRVHLLDDDARRSLQVPRTAMRRQSEGPKY